jgi:hypothetical protein
MKIYMILENRCGNVEPGMTEVGFRIYFYPGPISPDEVVS